MSDDGLRPRTRPAVWALRLLSLAMLAGGLALAWKKFHASDEQVELRRYVEHEVPALLEREGAIHQRLDRLVAGGGLAPEPARQLLVDDIIPRLVELRRIAASVSALGERLAAINRDYLVAVDTLIDACRASVRAIDDPAADPVASLKQVRARFLAAGAASRRWAEHLRAACLAAGLTPPASP